MIIFSDMTEEQKIASFNQGFRDQIYMMVVASRIDPPILQYEPELPVETLSCQGCGSRETIIHNGRQKCSYCRGDR